MRPPEPASAGQQGSTLTEVIAAVVLAVIGSPPVRSTHDRPFRPRDRHHPTAPAAIRGAAIIEVVVGAVILAVVALMALQATAGGTGLLLRGSMNALQSSVLLRALELSRANQSVPASLDGLMISRQVRRVNLGRDASIAAWGTNPYCQGSCVVPLTAIDALDRAEVTVTSSAREGTTLVGVTFTAP